MQENFRLFREARAAHSIASEPEILAVYHFYCGETAEKAKQEPRDAMIRYLGAAASSNLQPAYSEQYQRYGHLLKGFQGYDGLRGRALSRSCNFRRP